MLHVRSLNLTNEDLDLLNTQLQRGPVGKKSTISTYIQDLNLGLMVCHSKAPPPKLMSRLGKISPLNIFSSEKTGKRF